MTQSKVSPASKTSENPSGVAACPLCQPSNEHVVFAAPDFRVVRAHEADMLANFPAFYRLIWNAHVKEFSDLTPAESLRCMQAVALIERTMIEVVQPDKINLASLGNVVPHLHWHIIGRFSWDSHFPSPIWGVAVREASQDNLQYIARALPQFEQILSERLQNL